MGIRYRVAIGGNLRTGRITVRPSFNEALTLLVREGIGDALRPFAVTNITPPRVGGDLPGGDLERSEQAGGAVADVVVGLLVDNALAQRQDRLRSVQSLDLALLAEIAVGDLLDFEAVSAPHSTA